MRMELFNNDCFEVFGQIKSQSVDAIICDLPYGTTHCAWDSALPLDKLWDAYKRIIKPTGAIVLFGTEPFSSMLRVSNLSWFKYDWIWDKVRGTGFLNAKKQPMRNHEIISVFYQKQCTYNPVMTEGHERKTALKRKNLQSEIYNLTYEDNFYDSTDRYPRSIQVFSTDIQKEALHPTQKPLELLKYLVLTYTNPGETVLDNCMGSGTTGVACKILDRHFIGIEKEPHYFEVARRRIDEQEASLLPVTGNGFEAPELTAESLSGYLF